jgi:ATP/ADP translocase
MFVRHRRYGVSTHYRAPKKSRHQLKDCADQITQGVKFTFSSELLRASSFALFFMVIAFYILCYSVNRIYTQTFDSEESLTRFFGLLTAATSSIALFTQLFITNRVIERFGIRTINLLFPWTTLASLSALTFSFAFPAALLGSLNKDAFMPAFRNPVRSMFFNALPDYIQGRARAMSVAIVLPLALLACGLILILMQRFENPQYFLVPGMIAAGLYLFSSTRMNHAYVSTLLSTLKERLFLPDKQMFHWHLQRPW